MRGESGGRPSSPRRRTASLILAVLLAASPTGASTAQSLAANDDDAGTLRIGLVEGSRPSLREGYQDDPAIFSTMRLMRCCLARTLMAYPGLPILEGGTVLHPDLAAEPPTVSADGLLWTFRLRPDVRYQPPFDDRTVVAADIIRAIERSLRLDPELAFAFGRIEGVAAYADGEASVISGLGSPDPLTLTFRLTEPDATFGHLLSDPSTAPIPEGAADGFDPLPPAVPTRTGGPPELDKPFGQRFPSTGPYMWETYPASNDDGGAVLVRNPSWDPATDPLRPANVSRIEIQTLPSDDALFELVEQGLVDIADHQPGPERLDRYRRDPDLADRLHEDVNSAITYIPMNLAMPPFDDVAVRRAVNAVMDRAALMEAHLDGRSELDWLRMRLSGRVAGHVLADHLTAGLLAGYDPFASAGGHGSVAAGRAEMARSRYDTDGDGLCDAEACRDVRVAVAFEPMGDILRDGLAAIGIEATVVPVSDEVDMSLPSNRTAMQANWYQLGYSLPGDLANDLFGGGDRLDDVPVVNQSLLGATPAQLAAWGYEVSEVPSVERLLDRCGRQSGHQRARCWATLDRILTETIVPGLPVYTWTVAYLVSPRVRSVKLDPSWITFPALDRIELSDDATAR